MNLLHHAQLFQHLERRILCRVPTEHMRLALTFDDGPHPIFTPRVLEILNRKSIPATFFVVGKRVVRFPGLVAEASRRGHEIGNHTYHHLPLPFLPTKLVRREIHETEALITQATGRPPRFMRPPRGLFDKRVLRIAHEMGYRPVIGSVHPQDSRQPDVQVIVDTVRARIAPGGIIILHDGGWRLGVDRSQTVAAADQLTDELLESGYRFETLSNLVDVGGGSHG